MDFNGDLKMATPQRIPMNNGGCCSSRSNNYNHGCCSSKQTKRHNKHQQKCHQCHQDMHQFQPISFSHPQYPRQCHLHNTYDHQCHACNTPAPATPLPSTNIDRNGLLVPTFQNCQCYKCQRTRGEPYLHPAFGVPLGIATAGLGHAAFGIYRGVTMKTRARKAMKSAQTGQSSGDRSDVPEIMGEKQLAAEAPAENTYAVPSPVSAMSPDGSHLAPSMTRVAELADESSTNTLSNQRVQRAGNVVEIDGSPVQAPPPSYEQVEGENYGRVYEKM